MLPRPAPLVALTASLAAVASLAAGCGGGGRSPSVASLTTAGATTTASAGGGAVAGGPPAGNGGGAQMAMRVDPVQGAKFAACMRAHGVPSFPDPNGQGVISINASAGIDPRSPTFQKAQQTCRKVLPNGGKPTPQQLQKMQQTALRFSACMRSHGIKDFPDPTFSNGGASIRLHVGGSSDLNPGSPLFQRAQQACQGNLPFKGK